MYIASKYEEILHPYIGGFSYVTDLTCSKVHICQMETKFLKALDLSGLLSPSAFPKKSFKDCRNERIGVTVNCIWKRQYLTVATC